ncbi:MAG: alpha/beta hydrolase [Eubacteriales bacterium]|nr:alpha/beta hydrolase [Eubacteriales bacterium]
MALNKLMMTALKTLSYADIDVSKNYKIDRRIQEIINPPVKSDYNIWDHKIESGDYAIPVRIFQPSEQKSSDLLLFFHGGGWVVGSIDTYTNLCINLCEYTGRWVLSVDYRLAPEFPFPNAPNDCYAAAHAVYQEAIHFGANPDNTVLIGDSAGGNLAAVVSLMAAERMEFPVHRQILIYPSTGSDHTLQSEYKSITEFANDYLLTSKRICDYLSLYLTKDEDYINPYYAPLLAENLEGQPKTLIITAEYDPLRDEGEAYARKLEEAGCTVEFRRISDTIHGFIKLPRTFEAVRQSYIYIYNFLREKF